LYTCVCGFSCDICIRVCLCVRLSVYVVMSCLHVCICVCVYLCVCVCVYLWLCACGRVHTCVHICGAFSGVSMIFQRGVGAILKKRDYIFWSRKKCVLRVCAKITHCLLTINHPPKWGAIAQIVKKIQGGGCHRPMLPAVNVEGCLTCARVCYVCIE